MCDPVTLITGAMSAISGALNKPKTPSAPARPIENKVEEVDVVLGDEKVKPKTTPTAPIAPPKKAGSTVRTSKKAGINIL